MRSDAAGVFETNPRDKVSRRNPTQALALDSDKVMRREASGACSGSQAGCTVRYIIGALQAIPSSSGIRIVPNHAITAASIPIIAIADGAVGLVELKAFNTAQIAGQAVIADIRLDRRSAGKLTRHGGVPVERLAGVGAVQETDVEDVDVGLHELPVLVEERGQLAVVLGVDACNSLPRHLVPQ